MEETSRHKGKKEISYRGKDGLEERRSKQGTIAQVRPGGAVGGVPAFVRYMPRTRCLDKRTRGGDMQAWMEISHGLDVLEKGKLTGFPLFPVDPLY